MRTYLIIKTVVLILLATSTSADAGPFRGARVPQGYVLTPGHPVTVVVQPRPFYPSLPYPNQGYPTQGYIAPVRQWYYPTYYAAPVYYVPFGGCAGGSCR
jgi:hypothetical protein